MAHDVAPHMNMLGSVLLMLAVGGVIAFVFHRIRQPMFLAFILTGVLLGPYGLNLLEEAQVRTLAQVGIIFLLFIVGLDLSVDKLKQLRYHAPAAGALQLVITTVLLTLAFAMLAGFPLQLAFLLSAIFSLSSTTIVLKSLEDHREHDTDYGRLILGILIIQDLSIVPLMTLLPQLTTPFTHGVILDMGWVLLQALIFGAVAVVVSLRLVPFFLDRLASTNQKEVFTLAVVSISLGMAWLTEEMGLSYEAGAFVAGLALSGSVFCRQIIADSKGFRDVFITLFFVSMGLLFNMEVLMSHAGLVLAVTALLIFLKAVGAGASVRLLGFPHRTAIWAGLALFQVGEFSFILLARTLQTVQEVPAWGGLLRFWSPVLIDAIIITMFLTPLAIRYLPNLLMRYGQIDISAPDECQEGGADRLRDRVIIAGYGPTAQNLAEALLEKGIPFVVVEMNLHTVKQLNKRGIPSIYGDISNVEILKGAGVLNSRVLALTFPDIRTSELAAQLARQMNPDLITLVRSRYRADIPRLYQLGVDVVIHEEFETSVSFIFNIMTQLEYPIVETERLIALVRDKERATFGEHFGQEQPVFGRFSLLEGTKLEWLEVSPASHLVGKTLADSRIRQRTGVNVIAVISAGDGAQLSAEPDLVLGAHDVLVAIGGLEQLHALEAMVSGEDAPDSTE